MQIFKISLEQHIRKKYRATFSMECGAMFFE